MCIVENVKIKLHLIANSLNFIHNKFHIFFARSRHSVKDESEEVFEIFIRQRLVSDHEAAVLDHPLLDPRGHSLQLRPPLLGLLLAAEAGRDEPEAHVGALPALIGGDQPEAGPGADHGGQEPRHVEGVVHHLLHVGLAPRLQHEPELERVHLPPALDGFVARVVTHVVEFVL